jgi:predicted metal-dependent phosphoesterase TrpH
MRIDFHVHSCHSFDCFLEPRAIVESARRLGLDGLAVTDHDTMSGVEDFRKLAPDLFIIAGQEISTPHGDVLGLFLEEPVGETQDVDAVIAAIRRQGGLAVLAHPFKWPHCRRGDGLLKRFDALEAFNARNNIPLPWWPNAQCRRACARLGIPGIAGSDTHDGFEMGTFTVFDFPAAGADEKQIKEAVRAGRFRIEGREVSLPLEVVSHFKRLWQERRSLRRGNP